LQRSFEKQFFILVVLKGSAPLVVDTDEENAKGIGMRRPKKAFSACGVELIW
jgi:hypothetical protein